MLWVLIGASRHDTSNLIPQQMLSWKNMGNIYIFVRIMASYLNICEDDCFDTIIIIIYLHKFVFDRQKESCFDVG